MTSNFGSKTAELVRNARVALLLFVVLHGALFIFDLHNLDAFLRGDRGIARLDMVVQAQAHAQGLGRLFLATGLPGDYILVVPWYALFGQYAVILLQLAAGAATVLVSVGLARTLGASRQVAAAAGAFYCLLPGSVMDPHLLVTESLFTVVFAAGLWALTHAALNSSARSVWVGMGLLAMSSFIRPQALPFGLVAAVPLFVGCPGLRRDAVLAPLVWLLVFPGSWLLWRYLEVGQFGLGPSMFDVASNLRIRADRMALIASIPRALLSDPSDPGRLSTGAFLNLALHYPHALVSTFLADLVNFVANPGANALFGQYLQFYPPMSDVLFWKHEIDRGGVSGVVAEVFRSNGRLILAMLLTGAIHAIAIAAGAVGLCRLLAERSMRWAAGLIALVCLAESSVVFVSGLVRWTHRAPLEPVVATLAAIGAAWMVCRIKTPTPLAS